MEAKLKLWKTEIFDANLQSEILKNIWDPSKIWLLDLFSIRQCISLNQKQYKNKFDKIQNIAKIELPRDHKFFLKAKTQLDWIKNFESAINDLYSQKLISYEDYLFMYQNKISAINLSNMRKIINLEDNEENPEKLKLYDVNLEKQTKFSKKFTDTIVWLPEIPEDTYMASLHIRNHPDWEKFNITEFAKYIYKNCLEFENKYKIKPKYIFSITHLNLFFRRYWFDIYSLETQIAKRTWPNLWVLESKIYDEKPKNRNNEEWQKHLAEIPQLKKMQEKFTYKDIKFGIMEYDKFMEMLEKRLWE